MLRPALGHTVCNQDPAARGDPPPPSTDLISQLLRSSAQSRLLRRLYAWAYNRYADRKGGPRRSFHGIYPDFATAAAAVPASSEIGFDNDASAVLLAESRHRIFPQDYPVLFWLSKIMRSNTFIFDLGGNVGISYFGFAPYLDYGPNVVWLVHDVPAVVSAGRRIAASALAPGLRFSTSHEDLNEADILLAAGVLQYLEQPMAFLRTAVKRPPHVIINKTPVCSSASRVTLQAIGTSYCPYHLFNRAEFIGGFADLGYQLVDAWDCVGIGCRVPADPDYNIGSLSGFYFTLADGADGRPRSGDRL